jgi:hypothetical protein
MAEMGQQLAEVLEAAGMNPVETDGTKPEHGDF